LAQKKGWGEFWGIFFSVNSINFSFLGNFGQFFLYHNWEWKRKEKKRTLIITP
jgi:hypothetical protein